MGGHSNSHITVLMGWGCTLQAFRSCGCMDGGTTETAAYFNDEMVKGIIARV